MHDSNVVHWLQVVQIVTYQPKYAEAFRSLNLAWIEQLFTVEKSDELVLGDPKGQIIDKGGEVFIGLLDGNPVGTCALIKHTDELYELGKMAVSEEARGLKIGLKLGIAIIEKAKGFGGKKLFLETNNSLGPAISLYKKLGFENSKNSDSLYERCNIKMEMEL